MYSSYDVSSEMNGQFNARSHMMPPQELKKVSFGVKPSQAWVPLHV